MSGRSSVVSRRFNARIVNYADDFVICCKGQADEAMTAMREIMGRLKLTVNEEKTRICGLPEGRFDFLGYNFGRCYSTKTGRPHLGTRPSKKSIQRIIEAVHMHTSRSTALLEAAELVSRLNRALGVGKLLLFGLGHQAIPVRRRLGVMVRQLRHRQTKGAATAAMNLLPPRHISTSHQNQGDPEGRC
jgi:hypothetical protein